MFRFIIICDDDYKFVGTDNEAIAREWAENSLVYDAQTGLSLNADGAGSDQPIEAVEMGPDEESDEG